MKKGIAILFTLLCLVLFPHRDCNAAELTGNYELSNGGDVSAITDGDYNTEVTFSTGDTITITSADGSLISGIYVIWNCEPAAWSLTTDSGNIECGKNGIIHEYIPIDTPTSKAVITIPEGTFAINYIRIFSEGELPSDVQTWEAPCDKADFLIVPSHADDEILFFGGILPTYAAEKGARIQVVYLTEFWTTTPIREHEKLDGLWVSGIKYYPMCGNFTDVYSEDIETARSQYFEDQMIQYLVDIIRRCKPQVVVGHDVNGEYGHGFHMLTSETTVKAVEAAVDASQYPDSATQYGTWDVAKTYLHLYSEHQINLDLRTPLSSMGGLTALEVAQNAYLQHVSQQWCWFYVSDDYEYSCSKFGLYRTTVGYDTGNDMLENIILYKDQEAAEREAEQRETELAAQNQATPEDAEHTASDAGTKDSKEKHGKSYIIVFIILIILLLCVVCLFAVRAYHIKKERERKRAERRRRIIEDRKNRQPAQSSDVTRNRQNAQMRRPDSQMRRPDGQMRRPAKEGDRPDIRR